MSLKLRRGTNAERLTITPELGELIYTIDTKQLYAGDGSTVGGTLVSYNGSIQGALGGNVDLSGYNIVGNSGGLVINGNDGTIKSKDIEVTGTITASGTITANGNIVLGNADTDNVTIGADINSNIIPNFDLVYNLGSESKQWQTLWVGQVQGDLKGSVVTDDSTILVDAVAGVLRGQLEGNLVGPVQGNVQGNVIGDLTGGVKNSDGTLILDPGSDETPAEFVGNVTGSLTGTVTNGVLTTEFYSDPTWIQSLDGAKITGTVNANFIGDLTGSVFGNDSSMLVDGTMGVLRGLHLGELDTGDISIAGNTISGSTNGNLILATQGTGFINFESTTKIVNTTDVNPFSVFTENPNAQPLTLFSAFNDALFDGSSISIARAKGTTLAPTALSNGDLVGVISFSGLTGGTTYESAALIGVSVAGAVSTGIMPGQLDIAVTDATGTSNIILSVKGDKVVQLNSPELVAGAGVGEVNTASVATYVRININGVDYAIPAYAINT